MKTVTLSTALLLLLPAGLATAQTLQPDVINSASITPRLLERIAAISHRPDPAIVRLQVLLDRAGASPGVIDGYGGETPTSLAVGKIDPPALPKGRRVVVTAGGDAGDGSGARRWGLNTHHGWSLALTDADVAPGDVEGCVGAIG